MPTDKQRVIKFRAFKDGQMLTQVIEDCHGISRFFGFIDAGILNDPPVMQFTGLLDKNGKEIYEGDVIKGLLVLHDATTIETIGSVEYNNGFGAFCLRNDAGQTLFHHHLLQTFEIIGNLYENPELIKS